MIESRTSEPAFDVDGHELDETIGEGQWTLRPAFDQGTVEPTRVQISRLAGGGGTVFGIGLEDRTRPLELAVLTRKEISRVAEVALRFASSPEPFPSPPSVSDAAQPKEAPPLDLEAIEREWAEASDAGEPSHVDVPALVAEMRRQRDAVVKARAALRSFANLGGRGRSVWSAAAIQEAEEALDRALNAPEAT